MQRVKLSQDCYSEWSRVLDGVPQGTKLGPWLFAVMINDINVPGVGTGKYVDDTTISEIIPRGKPSNVQAVVDELATQSAQHHFRLSIRPFQGNARVVVESWGLETGL
ncbi:hypothetical protein AC249_AIPGENE23167 [Exaiptasia diaphana]|nr:hypothetical protein AC249_AIPGENE23167 [Exaiptasia diaphana]